MMFTPAEVAKNCVGIGVAKSKLSSGRMFLLAILAGAFIAIAGLANTTAPATITSPSVAKLVGACIFPAGLAMVLVAGSELFTGNSLMLVALLRKKITLGAMLRNWGIVYLGNLVGSVLVAAMAVYGHTASLFGNGLAQSMVNIAQSKATMSVTDAVIRGIMCNFLVCIAVWMSFAAKTVGGKLAASFWPIMLFVLCGFEHCVANMYYLPAGLFAQLEYGLSAEGLTVLNALVNNLIPVSIGNVIGGAGGVAAMYYGIYLRGTPEE